MVMYHLCLPQPPPPQSETPARQAAMSLPGQEGGPGWEDAESMV